jgi:organic anion transporter 5A
LIIELLGYFLGSFCLQTYVYPGQNVDIEEGDPSWIGAWWLGFPIIGSLIFVFAGPLIFFPERLPKENTDAFKRKEAEDEIQTMLKSRNINEVDTKGDRFCQSSPWRRKLPSR